MPKLYHQIPLNLQVDETISKSTHSVAILAPHIYTYPEESKKLFVEKDVFFDNMIFEGTPLHEEDYINLINEYEPDLSVLPDAIDDPIKTKELHAYSIKRISESLRSKLMGVAQGLPSFDFLSWLEGAILLRKDLWIAERRAGI